MRFPRTIRLDASDTRVFAQAAEPEEWAVSGAFAFANAPPEALTGKTAQAFARGFLGTRSFGWSTLVAVAEITPDELEAVIDALARHLVERYGAPSLAAALPAARAEAEFACGLCTHKVNTLLTVERELGPDGIVERFRAVEPGRGSPHAKIWSLVPDHEDDGGA
jgi:Family of unknown function (DUF6505)